MLRSFRFKSESEKDVCIRYGYISDFILVEGLSTSFWITSFMRFGTGICLACVNIVVGTLMIQLVPENMVGRVNGTILPLFMGQC